MGQDRTSGRGRLRPLYPRERTSEVWLAKSAMGHNRTHAPQQTFRLFDDFVGRSEERRGHVQ